MQQITRSLRWILATATLLFFATAWGATLADPEFRAKVAERFPGVTAEDITRTPVEGLWQISQNGVIAYISANGRYLLDGDLIDLKHDVNLSAQQRQEWRLEQLATVPESHMLIYAPPDPEHTITIFTDVNCFYCQRLHEQIDKLLEAGIRVRYLFYPLTGPGSESYRQAQAVWCSKDRKAALSAAMKNQPIPGEPGCDAPIQAHYQLATDKLGLRGTPAIITEQGRLLPPGIPVSKLIYKVQNDSQSG